MTTSQRLIVALMLSTAITCAQQRDAARDLQDIKFAVAQMAEELQALRLEVLQLRLDREQTRVEHIERELDRLREMRRIAQEEAAGLAQETAEIDAQIAQPDISEENRRELAAARSEKQNDSNRVIIERLSVTQIREYELLRQRQQALSLRDALLKAVSAVGSAAPTRR